MATHLDLEEQEQLDQLKHFWNTYGNLITWVVLLAVFGAFVAWNGWQYCQRTQAAQASALYDEVERSAQAGDAARIERALADMKDKFGGTAYAQQAGLLAAKTLHDKGNTDALARRARLGGRQGVRRGLPGRRQAAAGGRAARSQGLRRSAQAAVGQLCPRNSRRWWPTARATSTWPQGKRTKPRPNTRRPGQRSTPRTDYRRLVEVKLNAVGVDPKSLAAAAAAAPLPPRPNHEFQAFRCTPAPVLRARRCRPRSWSPAARGLLRRHAPKPKPAELPANVGAAGRAPGLDVRDSGR